MGAVASKGSTMENGPVIHAGRIVTEEEKKTKEMVEKMKRSIDIDETMIEDAWQRLQHRLDIELKVIWLLQAKNTYQIFLIYFMEEIEWILYSKIII